MIAESLSFLSSLGLIGALGNRSPVRTGAGAGAAVPEFKDVRRNVGTFTARGGTIGYLITPDAVVVIDSQFADTAPLFLNGMKPKAPRKMDLLINSHHHPDHTGGNKVMQPNVGKIVAHANVPGLQQQAGCGAKSEDNQAYADTTFDKDWKASVGKETVSASYYGPAHTGGDIAITFENANIAHMGDLMSFQRNPRADRPAGASIPNWGRCSRTWSRTMATTRSTSSGTRRWANASPDRARTCWSCATTSRRCWTS